MSVLFYHGTTSDVLPRILAEGLKPQASPGGTTWLRHNAPEKRGLLLADMLSDRRRNSVYLCTHPLIAAGFSGYIAQIRAGKRVILEIEIPPCELAKLFIDEGWRPIRDPEYGTGFRFEGIIKPEWIKRVADVQAANDYESVVASLST